MTPRPERPPFWSHCRRWMAGAQVARDDGPALEFDDGSKYWVEGGLVVAEDATGGERRPMWFGFADPGDDESTVL